MPDTPKMNYADGVLINATTYLVTGLIMDPPDEAVWLEILREVLPHVSRDRQYIDSLADAAAALVLAAGDRRRGSPDYARARYEAVKALGECARWRAALAWDAWKQREGKHAA